MLFINSKWLYQLEQGEGLSWELAETCLVVDVELLEARAWVYHAPALQYLPMVMFLCVLYVRQFTPQVCI